MSYVSKSQLQNAVQKINDNFARQDGIYADMTAGNLTDPNAVGTEREFTLDKSCGSASISDTGTAVVKSFSGRTVVPNQMVYPTNDNKVSGTKINITDGTENNLVNEVIYGVSKQNKTTGSATSFSQVSNATMSTVQNNSNVCVTELNNMKIYGSAYQMKTSGYQYLDISKIRELSVGKKQVDADDYCSAVNTSSDGRQWIYENSDIYCDLPAGTYKLLIETKTPGSSSSSNLIIMDSTSDYLLQTGSSAFLKIASSNYIFTISEAATVGIEFKLYDSVSRISILNTAATAYEPYTANTVAPNPTYPQAIAVVNSETLSNYGKNLLDIATASSHTNTTNTTDGFKNTAADTRTLRFEIDLWDRATANNMQSYSRLGENITSAGTYSAAFTKTAQFNYLYLRHNGASKDLGTVFPITNCINGKTYTVSFTISGADPQTVGGLVIKNIQVEAGSSYTSYVAYQSPITTTLTKTLNAIPVSSGGNVTINGQQYIADYIDVANKKIVRNTFKFKLSSVISGTDASWNGADVGMENQRFHIQQLNVGATSTFPLVKQPAPTYGIISDYFRVVTGWVAQEFGNILIQNNTNTNVMYIIFCDGTSTHQFTSLAEFKTWIDDHDVTVIYPIETPTEESLTDEEVSQLTSLQCYYPTTNLFLTTDKLTTVMDFTQKNPSSPSPTYPEEIEVVNKETVSVGAGTFGARLSTFQYQWLVDNKDIWMNDDWIVFLTKQYVSWIGAANTVIIRKKKSAMYGYQISHSDSSASLIDQTSEYAFSNSYGDPMYSTTEYQYLWNGGSSYTFPITDISATLGITSTTTSAQVSTATLTKTLNAIPVSSGGNVTINGQQYISDYIDVKNKKIVRNVGKILFNKLFGDTTSINNTWVYNNVTYHQFVFGQSSILIPKSLGSYEGGILSDCLPISQQSGGEGIWLYNNSSKAMPVLVLSDDIASTVDQANEYKDDLITENPNGYVLYWMKTSTTESLTDSEVADFLALKSYEGTTNFIVTTDDLTTSGDITYKGTTYDLKTISSHKYLYRKSDSESIITGKTSQTVSSLTDALVDLTRMFGKNNEPTIDQLYGYYPLMRNDLEYNKGQLSNFKQTSIKTTGLNQWDEQWELGIYDDTGAKVTSTKNIRSKNYISVFPSTLYYAKAPSALTVLQYDVNKDLISSSTITNSTFTTSSTTYYLTFYLTATTYSDNICINMSNSGYNDGTYQSYWEENTDISAIQNIQNHATWTYIVGQTFTSGWLSLTEGGTALTPTTNTPYIVKTTGDYQNKVYFFDGEYYQEDTTGKNKLFPDGLLSAGSVYDEVYPTYAIKRVGKVDLGSLDWVQVHWGANYTFLCTKSFENIISFPAWDNYPNAVCTLYDSVAQNIIESTTDDKCFSLRNQTTLYRIELLDNSYTDAATLKSSLNGVYLYYELAEPITVTFDNNEQTGSANQTSPLNYTYKVADFGTEEALPISTTTYPTYAPMNATVAYSTDFTRDLVNQYKNYCSSGASLDNLLSILGTVCGGTFTKTWDGSKYTITFNKS